MSKALYKNTIFELSIGIASSFSGMALNTFWKRAVQLDVLLFKSMQLQCMINALVPLVPLVNM